MRSHAAICFAVESSHITQPSFALTNGGSITAFGVPLTENFDELISSGSGPWVNNSTIPGWYHARTRPYSVLGVWGVTLQ